MSDELPYDYGALDPLATTPRYTTLVDVKARLGITGATRDAEITQAIVSAEWALDAELGRSLPDGPGVPDVSQPGPIQGIPEAMRTAALDTSIAVWKQADAPFGTAGSDEFFGALDPGDVARRVVSRNPVLRGFKIDLGFGVA